MGENLEEGQHGSSMDIYRGPISAEGMAVLECVGKSQRNGDDGHDPDFYGVIATPRDFGRPGGWGRCGCVHLVDPRA